ncbi:MAG: hypothetical protein WC523_03640 [Patescibacteria group bacterium]
MTETLEVLEEEIIKESTIRGENVRDCPFGLPVPESCENVGQAINRMAPTEGKESVGKANRIVYAYRESCKECPYASKILSENKKVDCNFGDTAAGKKTPAFTGSPLYPQTFSGIGLDGLYGYPLGFYADNNESRNLFFGLFSFLGFATPEELIKLAEEYDKCGETEKADIVDGLLKKMQSLKDEYKETFDKVQKFLEEYKTKYETDKMDTGLIWELADSWFGPRQVNR